MKKVCVLTAAFILALAPLTGRAADGKISFSGTVKAKEEVSVLADKKGKVSTVGAKAGEPVEKGAAIITLGADMLYSPADSKVSLVCCENR